MRYSIGALLAVAIANAPAYADAPLYPTLGASEVGFRHFAGHRYVTITAARVQREPLSRSRILADIPRLHLVYAVATPDRAWLAIRGAGTSEYPDFDEAASFVDFRAGRLVLPEIEDVGGYVSLTGYIARSDLVDLDPAPSLAPPLPGLRPVPPLWEPMGLFDPRSFAMNTAVAPFNGIVQLSSRRGYCTGFFVAPDIVVTAGHCIPPALPHDVTVTIERGASGRETISGTVLDARRLTDVRAPGEDWAVVGLQHPPRTPVTPLHFAGGDEFVGHASVAITLVGYPADLRAVAVKEVGMNAAVVSACIALLPETRTERSGEAERSALRLHAPCITFPGSSGGPALVWSAARRRYEVVGITSTYRERDAITPVFSMSTSATVQGFASRLAAQYGVPAVDSGFAFRPNLREDTPGAALLSGMLPTFGAGQPWANFPLSSSLAAAIGQATGHVPKMPIATLARPDVATRRAHAAPFPALSAAEMAAARAACALQCRRGQLDATSQLRTTIGGRLPVSSDDRPGPMVGARSLVVGGDLFVVDQATSLVRNVVRNMMNLVDAGSDAAWDTASACRCDDGPEPTSAIAESLPGAKILTARGFDTLRLDRSTGVTVLAADGAPLRVPGAIDVGFAAGSPRDEPSARRLAALLEARTGGDRARPVAVYGREGGARSGYTVAQLVLRMGYREVIWIREGLAGWAAAGLALSLEVE